MPVPVPTGEGLIIGEKTTVNTDVAAAVYAVTISAVISAITIGW